MSRKHPSARQVRRAYSQDRLTRILTMPERAFGRAFGMTTTEVEPPYRSYRGEPDDLHYHFRDNGASVLAVAHLDTVVRPDRRTPRFRATKSGPLVTCGALDDRLGAYVILDLLPRLGVTCDWLLTTGEESGQSTAGQFGPAKDYDHVIEFDRGGTDVVMYQYEDRASRRAVEAAGARMGQGSFSDIAYLEQLGVKAFNWGAGYQGNYHSEAGYAYLGDTFGMVAKYLRFHAQNAGTAMPHEPDYRESGFGGWRDWRDEEDEFYQCGSCGEQKVDSVTWYCQDCGICADCGATDPDVAAGWGDPDVDVCQCYTPSRARNDEAREDFSWQGETWGEYLNKRYPAAAEAGREAGQTARNLGEWHNATGPVPGHTPGAWAVKYGCLRCAARYPHPVADSAETARQALLDAAADAEDNREALDAAYAAAMERDS